MQQQQPTVQLDVDPELLAPVLGLRHLAAGLLHTEHLLRKLGLDGALAWLDVLQGNGSMVVRHDLIPAAEKVSSVDQAFDKMASPTELHGSLGLDILLKAWATLDPLSSWPRSSPDAQLFKASLSCACQDTPSDQNQRTHSLRA